MKDTCQMSDMWNWDICLVLKSDWVYFNGFLKLSGKKKILNSVKFVMLLSVVVWILLWEKKNIGKT
jgi:hypothetical protein